MSEIKNRLHGLFFGQLIGDAIGTRYEFMKTKQSTDLLKSDTANKTFQILGGGPFNVKPGQYTDDSEMALGIWYSLLKEDKYDANNIANKFYEWYCSEPFDIGRATRLSLCSGGNKENNAAADMTTNAKRNNIESLSNGCLMKISPIGGINVLLNKEYDLKFLAKEICELTNPNPICVDMSICYVLAIDTALKTGNPSLAYNIAKSSAQFEVTKLILDDAKSKPTKTKLLQNSKCIEIEADGQFQGYIGIAFQNAFYHLLNTPNVDKTTPIDGFTKVMVSTICLGGDVDTNACIAGALYAACYGSTCIKEEWKTTVMNFVNNDERKQIYYPLNHQMIWKLLKDKTQ